MIDEQPVDREAAARSLRSKTRREKLLIVGLALLVGIITNAVVKAMLRSQQPPATVVANPAANSDDEPGHINLAFFECLLKNEPEAMNDNAAQAIAVSCKEQYPDQPGPAPAKPSHLFGYATPAACAADKAKGTPSNAAARYIWTACSHLY